MTKLSIYQENEPHELLSDTEDALEITQLLSGIGVLFRRWPLAKELTKTSEHPDYLAAYQAYIDEIKVERNYNTVDILGINPEFEGKVTARNKFLNEHTHAEDEVRFFARGSGAFYLHINQAVYQVACTAGDLISVPAGTAHWFDMGEAPFFIVIRLFSSPEGWVADFTGSAISQHIPEFYPVAE